jgi:hypothetical protein
MAIEINGSKSMKKVTNNALIASFISNKYRDLILKPALKLLNRNQKNAPCNFWTMPYDSICQAIILNGFYERELLEGMCALVKDKNGIALDIGANIGNHSLFFSKHFVNRKLYTASQTSFTCLQFGPTTRPQRDNMLQNATKCYTTFFFETTLYTIHRNYTKLRRNV